MPKQIVMQPCFINYGDDAGGQFADLAETVEPNKDTALELARMGRTLYVNKADDPTKGQLTASEPMLKAAAATVAARDKADKADKAAEK